MIVGEIEWLIEQMTRETASVAPDPHRVALT
jgi:hypothetical protein